MGNHDYLFLSIMYQALRKLYRIGFIALPFLGTKFGMTIKFLQALFYIQLRGYSFHELRYYNYGGVNCTVPFPMQILWASCMVLQMKEAPALSSSITCVCALQIQFKFKFQTSYFTTSLQFYTASVEAFSTTQHSPFRRAKDKRTLSVPVLQIYTGSS